MEKGRRYSGGKKLNMKKVFAVIIAFAVIIMFIVGIKKILKSDKDIKEKTVVQKYFAVYTNNKWGVIDSKGKTIIEPTYDETIIIPNETKAIFICTYDVNYENGTYKTKVLNDKKEEILSGFETVQALENYDENNNLWYEADVLLVKKDGKYGLINYKGNELLKCEYNSITTVKGIKNSLITEKDGKLGLVDDIGNIVIPNEYKSIKPLGNKYEEGFIVGNEKYGVINWDKSVALETKYEEIKPIYGDGKFVVKQDGKWKIVDTSGKSYLEGKFDNVKSIDGENVVIQKNGKYGVTTIAGETKLETKYEDITYTYADNYIAKQNGKFGILNLSGETKLDFVYKTLIYRKDVDFYEGSKEEINSDLIDRDFNVKLTGIITEINTETGYMKVRVNGEYKYYNFKFEEKTNIELLKGNTLFLSKKDNKYGFVNKDGIVIVDYIYDDATEQNEFGYASVKKDGLWGCINSKGEVTISPAYALENSILVEFIGKWHRGQDLNLNYYTDEK
ncbi:MAG: WG repeat-containing protein [Clostridia bacterium]|jgi:hypothetical protein|nr:kWG Leptospira repeat protein [Clostridium sp. CAG:798]HBJ12594.1 WG repeat-containing protein [Clostridiales bacterium]